MTVGSAYEAIILAAGTGSRFGGGKLLAAYGDGVLLDGALAAALAAPVRGVTLVTGADAGRVAQAARDHAARSGQVERLTIVHAPDYAEGMGASLRAAAAALPADTAGVFVLLGDMPRIPAAVFAPLIAALEAGAMAAAPAFGGRRGNPVLIGRALIPKLLALAGDAGARAILKELGPGLALVEAPDDGVLFDVDEPGDLPGR
ncbi:MAG TPA: NTP transferase domain-containing protein [Phenylobacterium sp.]|nr:NTP transferase domain-containing protein [Phenylobacterium sp.]